MLNSEGGGGQGSPDGSVGPSPHDTPLSAGLRFVVELITWIAGPWAAAEVTGSAWAAVPALVVLMGLPSIFSTPGDKHTIIVATPGPARLAIEVFLWVVALVSAWVVWPTWAAVVVTLLVVGAAIAGWPRSQWLLDGAPSPEA